MQTRILLSFIFLFFLSAYCFGQENLVKNPSFEVFDQCPTKWNGYQIDPLARYWGLPTEGTADYFNECSSQAGVPRNWAGMQEAKDGKGYIGFSAVQKSSGEEVDYREYLQGELLEQLKIKQLYCISFYVSQAELAGKATDGLSAFLYEKKIIQRISTNLAYPIAMRNAKGNVVTDRENWVRICGTYHAKGNEKYIIIGNFDPIDSSEIIDTEPVGKSKILKDAAYYYVDDVSVKAISNEQECGCNYDAVTENTPQLDSTKTTATITKNENKTSNTDAPKATFNDISLLFPSKEYELTDHQKSMVKDVAKVLLEMDTAIYVYGHTDNVGSITDNKTLSQKRANSVKEELIANGIKKSKITSIAEGELKPETGNNTPTKRQINRRAVISIAPSN